jgi:hypothetical protein
MVLLYLHYFFGASAGSSGAGAGAGAGAGSGAGAGAFGSSAFLGQPAAKVNATKSIIESIKANTFFIK